MTDDPQSRGPRLSIPPNDPTRLRYQTEEIQPQAAATQNPPQYREEPSQSQKSQQPQRPQTAYPTESELFPGQIRPLPEETVLTWQAPSRPFRKRKRQYFTTIVTIALLVSLILFFAGQLLPIAVVFAVTFLTYVLNVIPPTNVTSKITTYGIRIEDNLYFWEELGRFWFDEKHAQPFVQIEVARFPGRLTMLLGDLEKEALREILSEVLLEERPKDTFFDSSAKWLQEHVPLEG